MTPYSEAYRIMSRILIAPLLIAASLSLAGCQTAQELAQEDDATCRSYGLQFGTPDYAQCRQYQQADRTARYQAYQQRQAIENAARAFSNATVQNEKNRKPTEKCSMSPPDKDGSSKRVCTSY
jgi:Tfp pilus assembly protein PilV